MKGVLIHALAILIVATIAAAGIALSMWRDITVLQLGLGTP